MSGVRFPNEIALVALRRPLQVNHAGSESHSMLHIKLLLTIALLPMVINHGTQHWPQEFPRLGICCIAGIQAQRHAAWIKIQVKLMQFFTKLQVFSDNIKKKVPLILKNLPSQFFTASQYEGTLYLLYTGMNVYQECNARENQALEK